MDRREREREREIIDIFRSNARISPFGRGCVVQESFPGKRKEWGDRKRDGNGLTPPCVREHIHIQLALHVTDGRDITAKNAVNVTVPILPARVVIRSTREPLAGLDARRRK